jgi:hypothetical protein
MVPLFIGRRVCSSPGREVCRIHCTCNVVPVLRISCRSDLADSIPDEDLTRKTGDPGENNLRVGVHHETTFMMNGFTNETETSDSEDSSQKLQTRDRRTLPNRSQLRFGEE